MISPATIKTLVNKTFPRFGVNKNQQITRLLYEISKRECISPKEILQSLPRKAVKFPSLKNYLLSRRFPEAAAKGVEFSPYLPALEIDSKYKAKIEKAKLSPKNIFVEDVVRESYLVSRFKKRFPEAKVKTISSLKDYIKEKRFGIKDYNKRRDNFFIIKEKFDFLKSCPCTANCIRCGYHILNLGFGCIYECTYCYLQEYVNSPGIIIPANLNDFFKSFKQYKHNIRLGTGEFTDSLCLDDITEFSPQLVEFFKKYPQTSFELKTKSNNIKKLLSVSPGKNAVIAWSLNPQPIIDKNEFYSSSLNERLDAAAKCADAGYRIGIHFDPIFYYNGWEKDYEKVVDWLFDKIPGKKIAWISLGTFRFTRRLKKIIENRFPENNILDAELLLDFDLKMRYLKNMRVDIYKKVIFRIKKHSKTVPVYLCMESKEVWKECDLPIQLTLTAI
ncbi:MAG: hypothetical protein V2A72_03250 [Candidatus Omnitrophota bacterium]